MPDTTGTFLNQGNQSPSVRTNVGFESFGSSQDGILDKEYEKSKVDAALKNPTARIPGSTKTYQVYGTIHENGTTSYRILSNGTKVYETRYNGDDRSRGLPAFENEGTSNGEYGRRVQTGVGESTASSTASHRSEVYSEDYGSHPGGKTRNFRIEGINVRTREEALTLYEIKRKEAEAAAKELEMLREEFEDRGHGTPNPKLYERIEALRMEYEIKRSEAEAAAAAATAFEGNRKKAILKQYNI